MLFYDFSKSQRGKIQTEKKSAFQLAEERRKDRGFGPSDGWTVGPVSPNHERFQNSAILKKLLDLE